MKLLKQAMAVLGTVVVIAVIVVLVTPKTAHALVATLVQVENTPTTAVPTVIAPAAGQLYNSVCSVDTNGPGFSECNFTPVPAGKTLIVETGSVETESLGASAPFLARLVDSNTFNLFVSIPLVQEGSNGGSTNFAGALSGRIGISVTPGCQVGFGGALVENRIFCALSGYLVSAQ